MTIMTEMCKDGLCENKNKSSFVDMSKKCNDININMDSYISDKCKSKNASINENISIIPHLSEFDEVNDYIKTDEIYLQEIEFIKRIKDVSDEKWGLFKEISHMFRTDVITKSEYIRAMDVLCVKR